MFGNQRFQQILNWPQICLGCGHPFREDLELFKFHTHKKKLVESHVYGTMRENTYTVIDLDVPALLCKNCYMKGRKEFIINMSVIYPVILGIPFLLIGLPIILTNLRRALGFFIFVSIVYGFYALITRWYYINRFNPAKYFFKLVFKKKIPHFKFKSAKFASAFANFNPGQKIIYPKS
ncbi:MAG: hypothetical protein HWN65_07165 [Candidatus Helarchaeota archaeon]|nr:hypothetical protein [Candidatus Helarchaeota archaeon]